MGVVHPWTGPGAVRSGLSVDGSGSCPERLIRGRVRERLGGWPVGVAHPWTGPGVKDAALRRIGLGSRRMERSSLMDWLGAGGWSAALRRTGLGGRRMERSSLMDWLGAGGWSAALRWIGLGVSGWSAALPWMGTSWPGWRWPGPFLGVFPALAMITADTGAGCCQYRRGAASALRRPCHDNGRYCQSAFLPLLAELFGAGFLVLALGLACQFGQNRHFVWVFGLPP